ETSSQLVTITNVGTGNLRINGMRIEGQGANRFSLIVADADGNPAEYNGQEVTITDEADDRFEIRVDYTPTDVGGADAVLIISSNDSQTLELRIPLQALEVGPQPQFTPNPIVFGQVLGGEIVTQPVTITNVGSAPMQVTGLELSG